MKRFRFTLQALLVVRQREENAALERYAATLAAQRRAAEALESAEGTLATAAAHLRARLGGGLVAAELAQQQNHLRTLEWLRSRADTAHVAAGQAVEPALRDMLQARRQREVVDEFRRRQEQRHQREVFREENRFQDEVALRRSTPSLIGPGDE